MSAPGPLVEVRLLAVPVALRERSTEHGDALLREMTLIAQSAREGDSDLPLRLLRLADEVRTSYAEFTVHGDAEIDAAAEAGRESVDVTYHVPVQVADFCRHVLAVVEEANDYCLQGQYLLTLATPPDVLAYQRWILGEFVRQVAGEPPRAWGDQAGGGTT